MPTHCSATGMAFGRAGGRELVAEFDGGRDHLRCRRAAARRDGSGHRLVERFAACFQRWPRIPRLVTHRGERRLVAQRVFGIALGYEDLVDHDQICGTIPVLAACSAGKLGRGRSGGRRSPARAR